MIGIRSGLATLEHDTHVQFAPYASRNSGFWPAAIVGAALASPMLFPGNAHSKKLQYRPNAGTAQYINQLVNGQSLGFDQLQHWHHKLSILHEVIGEFDAVLTVDGAVRFSHGGSSLHEFLPKPILANRQDEPPFLFPNFQLF